MIEQMFCIVKVQTIPNRGYAAGPVGIRHGRTKRLQRVGRTGGPEANQPNCSRPANDPADWSPAATLPARLGGAFGLFVRLARTWVDPSGPWPTRTRARMVRTEHQNRGFRREQRSGIPTRWPTHPAARSPQDESGPPDRYPNLSRTVPPPNQSETVGLVFCTHHPAWDGAAALEGWCYSARTRSSQP
jgi:hypothetical protein